MGSHLLCRLRTTQRQRTYFLGNDYEAMTHFTSSCSFYSGIERYKVHARGQVGDSQVRLVYFLTVLPQAFHDAGREGRCFTHLTHTFYRAINDALPI